jgi:tRNA(Phe) wybutosine-synthesizing methylase Tyw3
VFVSELAQKHQEKYANEHGSDKFHVKAKTHQSAQNIYTILSSTNGRHSHVSSWSQCSATDVAIVAIPEAAQLFMLLTSLPASFQ